MEMLLQAATKNLKDVFKIDLIVWKFRLLKAFPVSDFGLK